MIPSSCIYTIVSSNSYGFVFLEPSEVTGDAKIAIGRESKKELQRLKEMRKIKLTEPLSEKTRPGSLEDIVGQEDGIKALKAALCGPNPQHVIIYGPPGVGKTAAARLVLKKPKTSSSPFKQNARFVELDATIARFDERGIADPLIGSVHDPIYQGAGSWCSWGAATESRCSYQATGIFIS